MDPASEVSREKLTIRGTAWHYMVGGAGPTLLFVHGAGVVGQTWTGAFPLLARSFQVVVPDLPGFGESPPNHRLVGLGDLLDALGEFVETAAPYGAVVVGNSFGGGLAAGLALHYPRKVRALALLAPGGLVDPTAEAHAPDAVFRGDVNRKLFFRPEKVLDALPRLPPEEVGPRWRSADRTLAGWLSHGFEPVALDRLRIPTLVLWGAEDQVLPVAWAHTLHARIPGSTLVIVPECGHVPHLEAPEAVAAAVQRLHLSAVQAH